MRRVLLLCVIILCSLFAPAQTAKVKHNVNLRTDPSTGHAALATLHPPDELDLVDPDPTNGYYHVKTDEGEEGWVWGKNVTIVSSLTPAPVASTTTISTGISPDWEKPEPQKSTFHGGDGDCPWNGDDTDPDTFVRKNRPDTAGNPHDVAWQAIHDLPFPDDTTLRKNWSAEHLAEIAKYEGTSIRTVGFVVAFKPQKGHGEGTNCRFTKASETDTHVALVGTAGDGEKDSVVVEFTPRFLSAHPNWPSKLGQYSDTDTQVRITGWLMLDPDHRNHLNKYRYTLWEIHPITKIEVMQNGSWTDLDRLH